MASLSEAQIMVRGNVGRAPEIKFTKSGLAYCRFSVAVTERVKEGDEYVDGDTTWYEVTCWRTLAEDVAETVQKGQRVVVGGRFKLEKWAGDDEVERTTAAVTADWVGVTPRAPKMAHSGGKQQSEDAPPW